MGTIASNAASIIKDTIIDTPHLNLNLATTDSEGGGWINPNPMIVKPKAKSLIIKEFDSWPKLDPNGK